MDLDLESQLEDALANYNTQLDMGNDPVASGRNLLIEEVVRSVPVPKSPVAPFVFLVLAGLGLAFWFLFF